MIRELPEDRRRSLGPVTLTHTFEAVDGELRARIRFRLDEGRLSPDQVAALREGINALYREDPLILWFDTEGLREAIEIYRSIDQEELAGTDYEHDLPLALLHADRPREAVELLENDAESAERYALLVAAEAMANGADAAIERAERWRSDAPDERAAILGRAAQRLVSRRRYPEAAKLVRTAARIASTEDEVRDTIEMFETLRRYEEISVNPDDPAGLLRSLIVAVAKHDGTDLAHEVGSRMARALGYTLATALAERGETLDAYDALLRTAQQSPEPGVQLDGWYILGRIAEQQGFPRAALEYYRRAAAPDEDPLSAHALAQRRLHALDDL